MVCPRCKGAGMIAIGHAVQYCLCPTGREKKASWLRIPLDMRMEEEAISPTIPDLEDLDGVA
jgi:hypothetical protein